MTSQNRLSIAGMMVLLVVPALCFAALRSPTALWAATINTLAVLSVAIAILKATITRGPNRVAWLGSAIVGGTYAIVSFGLFSDPPHLSMLPEALLYYWIEPITGISMPVSTPDKVFEAYRSINWFENISSSSGVIFVCFLGFIIGIISKGSDK